MGLGTTEPAMAKPADPAPEYTPFEADVAAVLGDLLEGEVMTYGEIAAEAGHPGASRAVGAFLKRHEGFPWWRVVNAAGRLAPGHERAQTELLGAEGVAVRNGRVVFDAS